MTMVEDYEKNKMLAKAMSETRERLMRELKSIKNRPARPWRGETFVDEIAAAKAAITDVEDQIIDLEYSLRDPEQDAEMRAEINAAIAMSGNWNDDASLYMHTPMEERLFQESIQHDIDFGYFDSDGGWNEGLYSDYEPEPTCGFCNGSGQYAETFFNGEGICATCLPDIVGIYALMHLLGLGELRKCGRWDDEYVFYSIDELHEREDDLSDTDETHDD